ncbi:hypothetical protein, partial [Undibacterium sp. CCC3.4]|uniref:hypothetical protein n=1 Tax=Undibacterium sp. CCC3.4 TaxID=3048609 RepID=UPI002B23C605
PPVKKPRPAPLLKAYVRNETARPPLSSADYRLRMERLTLKPRDARAMRERTLLLTPASRRPKQRKKAP